MSSVSNSIIVFLNTFSHYYILFRKYVNLVLLTNFRCLVDYYFIFSTCVAPWSTDCCIGLMIIGGGYQPRLEVIVFCPWTRLLTHIVPPHPGEKNIGSSHGKFSCRKGKNRLVCVGVAYPSESSPNSKETEMGTTAENLELRFRHYLYFYSKKIPVGLQIFKVKLLNMWWNFIHGICKGDKCIV